MTGCAVITRTKSRPLLLQRAMASVSAQTWRDFVWVVVNDAGEPDPVEAAAAAARARGVAVMVLHRAASEGMEAASNAGIRASRSEFIAIHDDDDSWSPRFLERAAGWLGQQGGFAGVTTHCTRITERIDGNAIRRMKAEPHQPVLHAVQLADMLRSNLFPPISFLYRRSLYEKLGGYDETMAILGDWDFNIRALLAGDIGVLPEVLANYHVRSQKKLPAADYLNSVPPGSAGQMVADASYRNRWLRHDLETGKPGLGLLLAMARLSKPQKAMAVIMPKLKRWLQR